jgi:hypothetical protein
VAWSLKRFDDGASAIACHPFKDDHTRLERSGHHSRHAMLRYFSRAPVSATNLR